MNNKQRIIITEFHLDLKDSKHSVVVLMKL